MPAGLGLLCKHACLLACHVSMGTFWFLALVLSDLWLPVSSGGRGRTQKRMGKRQQSEAIAEVNAEGVAARLPGRPNKHKKSRPMTPELEVRQCVQVRLLTFSQGILHQ